MIIENQPDISASRYDRFVAWMRVSKWRQWLVLYPLIMVVTFLLLLVWIGVAYFRDSTERNAGAVAFNIVISGFIATIGLIIMHRGLFYRFRKSSQPGPGGSSPQGPLQRIDWPWALRLRHLAIYVIGMATLICTFVPYGNQLAIGRFITRYSAGRSSAGSLSAIVLGYLPMVVLSLLALALVHRQMKRQDAGLLDERGKAVLTAEIDWLFSFGAAFCAAVFLCHFGGNLAVALL